MTAYHNNLENRPKAPRDSKWRLIFAVIVTNFLVFLGAFAYLRDSLQSLEARAATDAENLTRLTAKNVESQIARVDLSMRMVITEIEKNGAGKLAEPASMTLFNESSLEAFPPAMRIADAEGLLLYGPGVSKPPNLIVAERDYFKKVRDSRTKSLVIGRPVLGLVTKKWVVPFARSIQHQDGTFAGLIAVSVPVELLLAKSVLNIQTDSLFLLVDLERRAISRITKGELQTNELGKVLTGPYATRAVSSNLPFLPGIHLLSGVDGIDRVVATQRLENASWFINVGVPWKGYRALWYKDLRPPRITGFSPE